MFTTSEDVESHGNPYLLRGSMLHLALLSLLSPLVVGE